MCVLLLFFWGGGGLSFTRPSKHPTHRSKQPPPPPTTTNKKTDDARAGGGGRAAGRHPVTGAGVRGQLGLRGHPEHAGVQCRELFDYARLGEGGSSVVCRRECQPTCEERDTSPGTRLLNNTTHASLNKKGRRAQRRQDPKAQRLGGGGRGLRRPLPAV